MKGLKFHPWLQGFSTADPCFGEICKLMGKLNTPIFFHDGTPCFSLPEQIGGLARRFPETKFVLGHSGLLWNWRSALEAAKHPNIWICLCGPHMRAMEILCRKVDPQRILWGTDFGRKPNREWRTTRHKPPCDAPRVINREPLNHAGIYLA